MNGKPSWGIFWRLRRLVVESNELLQDIHKAVTNDIPHKLDDHEQHLIKQDKKIVRIEQALQIPEDEEDGDH